MRSAFDLAKSPSVKRFSSTVESTALSGLCLSGGDRISRVSSRHRLGLTGRRLDPEDRMVGGIWDPFEVTPDRSAELRPIRSDDPLALVARDFNCPERLRDAANPEFATAGCPEVAHPVGVAATRHQVVGAGVLERRTDRHRTELTAPPAANGERGEESEPPVDWVEDTG